MHYELPANNVKLRLVPYHYKANGYRVSSFYCLKEKRIGALDSSNLKLLDPAERCLGENAAGEMRSLRREKTISYRDCTGCRNPALQTCFWFCLERRHLHDLRTGQPIVLAQDI